MQYLENVGGKLISQVNTSLSKSNVIFPRDRPQHNKLFTHTLYSGSTLWDLSYAKHWN